VLLSAGFIAGEALMAVVLAFVVLGGRYYDIEQVLPSIAQSALFGALVFIALYYMLVNVPLKASAEDGAGDTPPAS